MPSPAGFPLLKRTAFHEIGSFSVAHERLPWPWIALDPSRNRVAFPASPTTLETRAYAEGRLESGPSFTLPEGLGLPQSQAGSGGGRGAEGLQGFALDPSGSRVAVLGSSQGEGWVVTIDESGACLRSRIEQLVGGDCSARAVTFDRTGQRLWVSTESEGETALLLLDAGTHSVVGVLRSPPFPPPAVHELQVHSQDDAVLLLAACGEDGTFARVAGFTDGPPVALETALDGGAPSAGFVGFSSDGARVHLVEEERLRTHAWPGLLELSSVEFPGAFLSAYSGVVMGHRLFIDGQDADGGDADAVMLFDRSATRGTLLAPPVPRGMWVGRLGPDGLLTVEPKGEPAVARLYRFPEPQN